jgi:hypothetical protein
MKLEEELTGRARQKLQEAETAFARIANGGKAAGGGGGGGGPQGAVPE